MHDIRPAAQNNKIETPDFRAFSGGARCPGKRTSSKLTMPPEHPELQFRGVRHPAFVPRWVPDDVHVRAGDAGQLLQLVDDFDGKALSGWAARRRQRLALAP